MTSVAQLYIAPPESRNRWRKKVTGVICFVKDNGKKSYFLRMYSLVVSYTNCSVLSYQLPSYDLKLLGLSLILCLYYVLDKVIGMGTRVVQSVQVHSNSTSFSYVCGRCEYNINLFPEYWLCSFSEGETIGVCLKKVL